METHGVVFMLQEGTIYIETSGIQLKEGNTATWQTSPLRAKETPCVMFSKISINIMTGFSGIFLTTSSKYSLEKAW